ncbi:related to UPS1 - mitochondrial intermembrane space protein that regulates mitochondrial cardiolipin levels [Melanopsichium pennsylvanicum]|uniref:Related to UPS1 - mitochondrial intermembrane space protein that regulates mitochondrial cardiolipin levels n=2 Tax=Melanopsichium pennsylvanicum TaxID=63383 RepID=A0AAJ4XJQ6_9BASI|nr:conserved hypothetical protein [Melanopsichium pennsylvanicum 4]SNX83373.1 related to UPS1 - mitochondrial intermembrane space protein that regulates mitochondrial cardiolipin levels [Melanopsichium pennsylvanicum]
MVKDFVHQSSYDRSWSSCVRAYFLRYPNPNATHVLSVDVLDRRIEYRPVRGPSSAASTSSVTLDDLNNGSPRPDTIPVLCTTRLILKRGNLPKWAPSGLIKNAESWVMEESEVELDLFPARTKTASSTNTIDAENVEPASAPVPIATSLKGRTKNGRAMRSWTRNLDHTTVLAVTEGLVFKERFGFMQPDEAALTDVQSNPAPNAIWRSYCKTLTTAQIESQMNFGLLRRRIEKFGLARFVAHKDTSQQGIMWTRSQLGEDDAEQASSLSRDQGVLQRSSMPQKRIKLLESLRPPFLDGYPLGPWQKIKMWWYSGHYSQVKELHDGYLIERDEDEDGGSISELSSRCHRLEGTGDTQESSEIGDDEPLRFRGAEQEGPWAELSGRKGKGAVYSDQDRNVEEGVLNRVRARLGLPLLQPPPEEGRKGILVKSMERARNKAKSLLGLEDDEMHAKQQTQGRLERIDRNRTV